MASKGAALLERLVPGQSKSMIELRRRIELLNTEPMPVFARCILITGPSGAGKSYLAKVLAAHREFQGMTEQYQGSEIFKHRIENLLGRYGEIHLPALPDQLIESELFGYKKNAFTGALKDKPGLLSTDADRATSDILLDEIGDAALGLQAKLLEVVDSGRFRPVGADTDETEQTSARLIFATNKDLKREVRAGRFREDLFWRLCAISLEVPPLKDNPENISELATKILADFQRDVGPHPSFPELSLSKNQLDWLAKQEWRGNIRQLRSLLQLWVIERGRVALPELIQRIPSLEGHETDDPSPSLSLIARLRGGESFGDLNGIHKEIRTATEAEIVRWLDEDRPSDQRLSQMFPKMQTTSIRAKISNYRGRAKND